MTEEELSELRSWASCHDGEYPRISRWIMDLVDAHRAAVSRPSGPPWRPGPATMDVDPRGFGEAPDGTALFAVWVNREDDVSSFQYAVGQLDDAFYVQTDDG